MMTPPSPARTPPRISCLICAYNEGPRLAAVLAAASGHPLLDEVIVVDDGSADDTAAVARGFAGVRVISHERNQGKSRAIATGVEAARHELLMLLDADLKGLRAVDVASLAEPVLSGRADVSISLRRNSLGVFRAIGMDFVSGERVVRRELLAAVLQEIGGLPRFGIEVYMNRRIIERAYVVAVTRWDGVSQARKTEKLGPWRGMRAEWRMVCDLLRVAHPLELLAQSWRLSQLRRPRPATGEVPGSLRRT